MLVNLSLKKIIGTFYLLFSKSLVQGHKSISIYYLLKGLNFYSEVLNPSGIDFFVSGIRSQYNYIFFPMR